ncbi:MAG: ribonuclease HII [Coriobacteriales bacterium]|nr:ribonuclease HII [Coriobacteriales bacterium]
MTRQSAQLTYYGDGVIGLDEVGRGPLAGPLCVAAVMLPDGALIEGLNDSKKVSPKRRLVLAEQIADLATAIGLAYVAAGDIDRYGIGACLRKCFRGALDQALAGYGGSCSQVLVDGRPLGIDSREEAVVKGDATIACIAAASIYAKVHRDALMVKYAEEYPEYGFEHNKGYGTAAHIAAIKAHGLTPIHRRSFCGHFI